MSLFATTMDSCFSGAAKEAVAAVGNQERDIRLDTYVTSVSEHENDEDQNGRLSMWRAFGETSARVAIVIRVPLAAEEVAASLRLIFNPVAYLKTEDAHAMIHEASVPGTRYLPPSLSSC